MCRFWSIAPEELHIHTTTKWCGGEEAQNNFTTSKGIVVPIGHATDFWDEAILHSVYLLNRLPSSSIDWKTPYQLLYSKEVDYSNLRCFGSLCFLTIVKPNSDKFSPRASKCIFVGYSPGQKGYKLYDLVKEEFIVTRNVIFCEGFYPFKTELTSSKVENAVSLPIISATQEEPKVEPRVESSVTPTMDRGQPSSSPQVSRNESTADESEDHMADAEVQDQPRRSSRHRRQPAWLADFKCQVNHASQENKSDKSFSSTYAPVTYPFVISNNIPPAHVSYVANISAIQEPTNYTEAKGDPRWVEAMKSEVDALEKNNTWQIVDLPTGKKPHRVEMGLQGQA